MFDITIHMCKYIVEVPYHMPKNNSGYTCTLHILCMQQNAAHAVIIYYYFCMHTKYCYTFYAISIASSCINIIKKDQCQVKECPKVPFIKPVQILEFDCAGATFIGFGEILRLSLIHI